MRSRARVDAGARLGQTQLHGGELGHAAAAAGDRAAGGALARHGKEVGERALGHAEHRRHDRDRQHGEERLPIKLVWVVAHPRGGRIGELGEGEHAMGGNEGVASDDVLAAGAREPHRVPIVVDGAVGGAQQEKSRRRSSIRLRDHAAEELPLRVVATAAEASNAGEPIAAIGGDGAGDRRISAGGERGAVLPDLVLRRFGEAGDEPLVRGEEPIDPAGRAAAAGNGGDDLRENIEAVFESAISAWLHDAKKVGLPHALDHVLADAALGFGLLRPLAGQLGDRARAPADREYWRPRT